MGRRLLQIHGVVLLLGLSWTGCHIQGGSHAPGGAGPWVQVGRSGAFLVGAAAVRITPTEWENWSDLNGNGEWDAGEPFFDHGVDRKPDWQETGAYGPDGQPGFAGLDDDGNGQIDDSSEYGVYASDDVSDPAGDNWDPVLNPTGTERDGFFQMLTIAGFQGAYGAHIRNARSIHDPLWARTLVVERGGVRLVVQSLDLVGLLHLDLNPVKRRVEKTLGIPFRNIIICSTHNHQGPDPIGLWSGQASTPYQAFLQNQMYQSIQQAVSRLRPARMKSVTANPPWAYDRKTRVMKRWPMGAEPDFRGDYKLRPTAFDVPILQNDKRDPQVRYTPAVGLQFDDATTGKTICTFINWHNHPEVLGSKNTAISSDFPHYLRKRVETRIGGICIYASGVLGGQIGALGDTPVPLYDTQGREVHAPGVYDANGNPFPKFVRSQTHDKIRSIGYLVADEVLTELGRAPYESTPVVQISTEDLDVDFENPNFVLLAYFFDTRKGTVDPRDGPVRAPYLNRAVGGIRTQITVASIGPAEIVTSPGETCPEYFIGRKASVSRYSHRGWPDYSFPAMPSLVKAMKGREKILLSLANNYLGYLVPRTDLVPTYEFNHPNHYEELVTSGDNFGDNVGNKLFQMLGSPNRFSNYPIRP